MIQLDFDSKVCRRHIRNFRFHHRQYARLILTQQKLLSFSVTTDGIVITLAKYALLDKKQAI